MNKKKHERRQDTAGKTILRKGAGNFETVNGKKNHHNSKMGQKIK